MEKHTEQVTNPFQADWAEGEHFPTTAGSQQCREDTPHAITERRSKGHSLVEEYSVDAIATLCTASASGIPYREMPGLSSSRNKSRGPYLSRKRGFFNRICMGVPFSYPLGWAVHPQGWAATVTGREVEVDPGSSAPFLYRPQLP